MQHLALVVGDVAASIDFYGRYFGFRERYRSDGVVLLRNELGFDLALEPGEPPGRRDFFHVGSRLASADAVRSMRGRLRADGVEIDEPMIEEDGYVAFKCLDPDGYRVEFYWEP